MGVSVVVHLMIGALAVGGALLIVLGWETVVQPVLGLLLICLAAALRPPRGKVNQEQPTLAREDAPRLFALLDEIAESLGTRGFDAVRVTHDFSVSAVPFGLRGRRLDIGLALWESLTPQQRIACVAHELGHFTVGDVRHNLVVRTVLPLAHGGAAPSADEAGMLREQAMAASPRSRLAEDMAQATGRFRVDSALSRWGLWIVSWPQRQLARLVHRLAASLAEETELRSDALAARVASTEAVVRALECRCLSRAVTGELRRLAVEARTFGRAGAAEGLWQKVAAHAAGVSGDMAHPHHGVGTRIRVLREGDVRPATVAPDGVAVGAVERELEPTKKAVAERFIRDGVGVGVGVGR
ncbi:MAG: hypothetical protein H5T76_20845 [Streptomyces sp.]|nr:hypothetical protein [Streptomyces sp.]